MFEILVRRAARWWSILAAAATAVVVAAGPAAAVPPDPSGPVTMGIYAATANYNGDVYAVTGWKVRWQIPQHTNDDQAWMAVGQWHNNLETGVYYTPHEGWWVYYYGDDDGHTAGNGCTESWGSGGHCRDAMENLRPGQQLVFTYRRCVADDAPSPTGGKVCAWVDMLDGNGDRFLASDAPEIKPELPQGYKAELGTHDVETFGDSGYVEPIIPCSTPVKMLGQQIKIGDGAWAPMTGNQWDFNGGNANYEFRNVNTAATPATWEACSRTVATDCPPEWSPSTTYVGGNEVGYDGRKYRARWWTYNDQPGTAYVWEDRGTC